MEYTRTTPRLGTPERKQLDELAIYMDTVLDQQCEARSKLRGEISKAKYGSKKSYTLQARLDKLKAKHDAESKKEGFVKVHNDRRTALLEDVVDKGDEANHLAALIELKHPMTGASDRIAELVRDEVLRQGVLDQDGNERIKMTTGSVCNLIHSFPSIKETAAIRVANDIKVENRKARERAIRDELNDLNISAMEREAFLKRIDFYSDELSPALAEARELAKQNDLRHKRDTESALIQSRRYWAGFNQKRHPDRVTRTPGIISFLRGAQRTYNTLRTAAETGWATDAHWLFKILEKDLPAYKKAAEAFPGDKKPLDLTRLSPIINTPHEDEELVLFGFGQIDQEWYARFDSKSGWTVLIPEQQLFMIRGQYPDAGLFLEKATRRNGITKVVFAENGKPVGVIAIQTEAKLTSEIQATPEMASA